MQGFTCRHTISLEPINLLSLWIYGLTPENSGRHGAAIPCICVRMSYDVPVGRLRLGFSSATPISGKPCMVGTCQCLFACCAAEAWGGPSGQPCSCSRIPFQMSQPAPTQNDCYLGNSRMDFPLQYLSTGSSAGPILTSTHRKQHHGWMKSTH